MRTSVFSLLAFGLLTSHLHAQQASAEPGQGWTQFRGNSGQGLIAGPAPTQWNEKSRLWTAPVPGRGWSSPVVLEGKVWLTTAVEGASEDPKAKKGSKSASFRLLAYDQKTGTQLHDLELFNAAATDFTHARNSLASPTPVTEKGKIYAHFGKYGTGCVATDTGSVLWKHTTLQADHETGPGSSPFLYKDKLICTFDGADDQFVAALDTKSGEVVWKTSRPQATGKVPSNRRAFCTPLLIQVNGQDQIVLPGAYCVYAHDPQTGAEIWRVKTPGFSTVPRPIAAHGLVYVCTGFAPPELYAIRPDGKGDVTATHIAWKHRKNAPNIPSPIVVGNFLVMVSDQGTATCLDARTGSEHWTQRLGSPFAASLLAQGDTLYAFGEDGKSILFKAADSYQEVAQNSLPGRVMATPAVMAGTLFIRTDRGLCAIAP